MLKKIWESLDGKKLWSAIVGAITLYGVPYARTRWPFLPWDEVLIPLLVGLGVVGAGHRVAKRVQKSGAVFTLILLLCLAPSVMAFQPSERRAVTITKPHVKFTAREEVKTDQACVVEFEITVLGEAARGPQTPLYVNVGTSDALAPKDQFYTIDLLNMATGVHVFMGEYSTKGAYGVVKLNCWIDSAAKYLLTVRVPPPKLVKRRIGLFTYSTYRPPLNVYIGTYHGQDATKTVN